MNTIFDPNKKMLILQGLFNEPSYQLSNEMIKRLLKQFGHSCGLSEVDKLIKNLENRGFLTVEILNDELKIAHLTRRGQEVADGSVRVEGIDPPPLES